MYIGVFFGVHPFRETINYIFDLCMASWWGTLAKRDGCAKRQKMKRGRSLF